MRDRPKGRGGRKDVAQAAGASHSVHLTTPAGEPSPVINPHTVEVDGRLVGRYQVVGEIARGSKSVILKARDPDLGRDVALKLLKRELTGDALAVQRFVEESQVGAQLQHPGIIPVYELGLSDDGRPFFTMKLVQGETLAILLASRKSPRNDRRRFLGLFEKICHAMAYAHTKAVIHRDLRPWNMMVGNYGDVVVMDWGYARVGAQDVEPAMSREANHGQVSIIESIRSAPDESDLIGVVLGTPGYMSPEQAAGDIEALDERSDVFALGAMLTEILTGAAPYRGDRVRDVLDLALHADQADALDRLKRCNADPGLVDLATRCMTPTPAGRPRNAEEVATELGSILTQKEVKARQAQVAAEAEKIRALGAARARKLTLAVAGVALVAVAFGTGIFYWLDRSSRLEGERVNRQVLAALRVAADHRKQAEAEPEDGPERWSAAIASTRSALDLATSNTVDPATRKRVEILAREVAQAAAAARASAETQTRVKRLVKRITEIRAAGWEEPIPQNRHAEYVASFAEAGFDFQDGRASAIAESIDKLDARDELIGALDDWILVTRSELVRGGPNRPLIVLQLLDKNAGRNRIRSLLVSSPGAKRRGALLALLSEFGDDIDPATGLLLGSALIESGAPEFALAPLRAAAERTPGDFWAQFHLGVAALRSATPSLTEAVGRFSTAVALRPWSHEARHGLAESLYRKGETGEAASVLRSLLQENPADGHASAHLGLTFLESNATRGHRLLDNAATAAPDDAWVRNRLGVSFLARKEWSRAVREFTAAMEAAPGWREPCRNWVAALAGSGGLDKARRRFEAMADDGPGLDGLLLLGETLTRLGKAREAVDVLERAVAADPGDAEALYSLGVAQISLGDHRNAIESFTAALAKRPGFREARRRLALARAAGGELDQALSDLSGAARDNPDDVAGLCDVGWIQIRSRSYLEALDTFGRAERLAPKATLPLLGSATALHRLGRATAVGKSRAALALHPFDIRALRQLHEILRATGAIDNEVRTLTRARNQSPRDPARLVALASAQLAAGSPQETLEAASEALRHDDGLVVAQLLKGLALEALGKSSAAADTYEQALRLEPGQAEVWCRLGKIHLQAGRFDTAIRCLSAGNGMGTLDTAWSLPSDSWLGDAMRMKELEPRIEAILSGRQQGEGAAETLEFASLLARKGEAALAARLFRRAWELGAGAFPEPCDQHADLGVYSVVAAGFPAAEKEEWNRIVLAWLGQGQLSIREQSRDHHANPDAVLERWLSDAALSRFRAPGALDKMPVDLASSYRDLWAEIGAVVRPALAETSETRGAR